MSVSENLEKVRERIARAGRNPDEVTIVAVTKGFPAERCREALAAGLTILGENRVHEALAKMEELGSHTPTLTLPRERGRETEAGLRRERGREPQPEWHLIGHLQTNKVRTASGHFSLIQSVDSVRLASLIAAIDPHQAVLVEVNTSREPQKSGVDPEAALTVIKEVARLLDLRGLMTVGPASADPKPAFEELTRLRDTAQQALGRPLPILSMGMSGDFEAAVAAGSTMLRLGQLLFGPRPA